MPQLHSSQGLCDLCHTVGESEIVVHNTYMLEDYKPSPALVKTFHDGTKLTYKKGEYIIHPGETPTGVFFLESGMVKAYYISKYGEENLLSLRKSHEIFPLIWAMTGSGRNIIYQALAPTVVWRVSREQFASHVKGNPDALLAMLELTLAMYRVHSERILNLEYRTVRERLISFLLITSERFGRKLQKGSTIIDVPLKQQDIASSISATRETTSRELIKLERQGLIHTRQAKITLVDIPKLKSYL